MGTNRAECSPGLRWALPGGRQSHDAAPGRTVYGCYYWDWSLPRGGAAKLGHNLLALGGTTSQQWGGIWVQQLLLPLGYMPFTGGVLVSCSRFGWHWWDIGVRRGNIPRRMSEAFFLPQGGALKATMQRAPFLADYLSGAWSAGGVRP